MRIAPVHDLEALRTTRRATLTLAETAHLLGIDPRSASRAVAAKQLPGITVGRRVLVPVPGLRALLLTDQAA